MHKAPTRRLWVIEKPLWLFLRCASTLWRLTRRVWTGLMRFLNRDFTSIAVLCAYSLGGALFLSFWPPTARWLGIHRTVDVVLVTVFLLWGGMFLVWMHERVQEHALRFLPAVLSLPLWVPPLMLLLLLVSVVTVTLLALSLAAMPMGAAAMLVGLLYSWWRRRHGITVRCTKGECLSGQLRFRDLEVQYVCPGGCGARYGYLMPSHFGLFFHNCTCGARLPAARFLRDRVTKDGTQIEETLQKVCPKGHPWGIGSEALPSRFLCVVGGTSAGKTCFMTMAVQHLMNDGARCETGADSTKHGDRYKILKQGRLLPPTQRGVPEAIVLRLHRNKKNEARLYLYDAAGEEYSRVERGGQEEFVFFQDLTGVILILDPLGLPKLHQDIGDQHSTRWEALKVSETPLEDVVASLRRNVRKFLKCGRSGRASVPLAVVINKADVPEVGERVGTVIVRQVSSETTEHDLCRKALLNWGARSEVAALEHEFALIRYFSCSTLGRIPDDSGTPFVPERVLQPLDWLMNLDAVR